MKSSLFIVYIFLIAAATSAATPMARVVAVADSRTIVVDTAGKRSSVVLAGVAVEAVEEAPAAAFLRQLVEGTWLLIEEGNAYRSPDGLYVNGEMQRHAWRAVAGMRYLGQSDPGPRRTQTNAATPRPRPAKTASPSAARSRGRLPSARLPRRN